MSEYLVAHYPEESAPFGELDIVEIPKDTTGTDLDIIGARVRAQRLTQEAWKNSPGLQSYMPPTNAPRLTEQDCSIVAALQANVQLHMASRYDNHAAFVAVRPGATPRGHTHYDWLLGNRVVGWVGAKDFVPGGFWGETVAFLLHPDRIERRISGIAVHPENQRKGIGVALLHALLQVQPEEGVITTYVPSNNYSLIGRLTSYGFDATYEIKEPIVSAKKKEAVLRMQASRDAVQAHLASRYGWLRGAVVTG